MTFERLLKDYLVKKIDEIFFELSNSIGALMKINKEIQYIDGTKLDRHGDGTEYPAVVRQVAAVQGRPPAAGVPDALRVRTVASDACPSGDLYQPAAPGPDEQ